MNKEKQNLVDRVTTTIPNENYSRVIDVLGDVKRNEVDNNIMKYYQSDLFPDNIKMFQSTYSF